MIADGSDELLDVLKACERSVWDALVCGDDIADQTALHERFLGVYPDGFASKADHVGQLVHGPTIQDYDLTDFRLIILGIDHALLCYHANFVRVARTEREAMYVSSIWQRGFDRWANVFSQDTPAA
jgi:hypothetical protein